MLACALAVIGCVATNPEWDGVSSTAGSSTGDERSSTTTSDDLDGGEASSDEGEADVTSGDGATADDGGPVDTSDGEDTTPDAPECTPDPAPQGFKRSKREETPVCINDRRIARQLL